MSAGSSFFKKVCCPVELRVGSGSEIELVVILRVGVLSKVRVTDKIKISVTSDYNKHIFGLQSHGTTRPPHSVTQVHVFM